SPASKTQQSRDCDRPPVLYVYRDAGVSRHVGYRPRGRCLAPFFYSRRLHRTKGGHEVQGDMLSIAEATRRVLGVTEPTLRGMVRRGELRAVRVGRRILIPEDELRRQFSVLYRPTGVAR